MLLSDLDVLNATAGYFRSMKEQAHALSSVASKLEQTAEVFGSLARFMINSSPKAVQEVLGEYDSAAYASSRLCLMRLSSKHISNHSLVISKHRAVATLRFKTLTLRDY